MSALIKEGKMCFSVFGRGYDDVRADSGEGAVEDFDRYAMGISYAVFDSTNQYVWLGCYGNGHTKGLLKYEIETFEEVSHTVPTTANEIDGLFHASNIDNNLGLVVQGSNWWVFDLTDDSVIANGSDANLPTYIQWSSSGNDCVLDGTTFKITNWSNGQYYIYSVILDYSDGSVTYTTIGTNRGAGAFVTKDIVYMNYPTTWFYQNRVIEGVSPTGVQVWSRQAPEGGIYGFANISLNGFGQKGLLYVPTFIYASWRMGEYRGTSTPDFETPKPLRVFGKFESEPKILKFARSNNQKRVAFTTDIGLFYSDYEELEKISEDSDKVLAINDNYIIASQSSFYIKVIKYR